MLLSLSEAQLQSAVIELATLLGWRLVHFRPAIDRSGRWTTPMQGDAGWPDLVLCRPPRLVFLELKSTKGRVTTDQTKWLVALQASGAECAVVRPEHWRSGSLEQLLS